MDTLYEIFYLYPLFSLLQTAFMIWMLVDAYRRGAEWFWFLISCWFPASAPGFICSPSNSPAATSAI